ncbi:fungal-specific transcription factor domain-containing protein [Lophiotrema nucula]|uniref:Fungal-specific transcription factor domain-containing protein n=1 Tax=Lophiotrema nucula TaxID=690887 RepID=A0A6A5YN04_9PLEO|nr:fungal-specific transcription factor domain-containing protein [Lophiotrema nucula]
MPLNPPAAKRQCWECLKRRLVCDYTQPSCKKCINAGRECPGYDEKKPLKWLDPGRVTSKSKNKSRQRKHHLPPPDDSNSAEATPTSRTSSEESLSLTTRNSGSSSAYGAFVTGGDDVEDLVDQIYALDWRDDTSDIVQAVYYYNSRLYPELLAIQEIAPNPFIIHFPPSVIPWLPASIRHNMVLLALSYQMHTAQNRITTNYSPVAVSRLYHHRGQAIRSLKDEIALEGPSDRNIAAVIMFACFELQQSTTWRHHVDALGKLINLRGGITQLYREISYLRPSLVLFVVCGVFGNSTSPAWDQITVSEPAKVIDIVVEMYETIFPHILCPQPLFINIININLIRSRMAASTSFDDSIKRDAEALLDEITTFSADEWADMQASHKDEWVTLGSVYHSAVMLYCLSSLQSIGALLSSPELNAIRTAHGDLIYIHLQTALASWRIRKFMMWPLVIAGVEAKGRSSAVQARIGRQLEEMTHDIGTFSPTKARSIVEKFWASDKTGWDDCFEEPHVFFC